MMRAATLSLFLSSLLLIGLKPAALAQDSTLLSGVAVLTKGVTTKRVSSWDKTGGNADDVELKPGETLVIADIKGAFAIKHFWMTIASDAPRHLRNSYYGCTGTGEESERGKPSRRFFRNRLWRIPFMALPSLDRT